MSHNLTLSGVTSTAGDVPEFELPAGSKIAVELVTLHEPDAANAVRSFTFVAAEGASIAYKKIATKKPEPKPAAKTPAKSGAK